MGKVIFWIVVFFLVLLALRLISVHKARREDREAREDQPQARGGRDTTPAGDTMVRCANCAVYIPKANAVMSSRGMVCGNAQCEHRKT